MRECLSVVWRAAGQGAVVLAAAVVLSLGAAEPVGAETSAWSARLEAPKGRKVTPKREGRVRKPGAKSAPPRKELPKVADIKGLPPAEAAYVSFEQGRYLTALEKGRDAATKGVPAAHTLVGRILAEGLGIPQDFVAAARWYKRAAELGDVEGSFALGVLYTEGRGVPKDFVAAAKAFELAAEKGHALAHYNLALMFIAGRGKPENPVRGAQHLAYAAEHGVVAAQYDLAALFLRGHGVEPNALEAARWIARAADAGMPEAELDYALMLLRGRGLVKDVPRAAAYLTAAAEKGNPVAQNRLARLYANGLAVRKDLYQAAKWHLIAAASGIKDPALDALVKKLTPADRLQAIKAAEAWHVGDVVR